MGMFRDKKYKLIRGKKQNPRGRTDDYFTHRVYRLKALRDIPEHGVKAGDLGGLVTNKRTLSHEGSCWIAEGAEAFGYVFIEGDAYIGDNASLRHSGYDVHAIIVSGKARITGNAIVEVAHYKGGFKTSTPNYILDNVQIHGNAKLKNVSNISGDARIYGDAYLSGVKNVTDTAEIFDNAYVGLSVVVCGNSKIHGKAKIEEKSTIRNSDISGDVVIPKYDTIGDRTLTKNNQLALTAINYEEPRMKEITSMSSRIMSVYNEVMESIAAYENDIVKIIKYPAMTDRGNSATREMTLASKTAQRLLIDPQCTQGEFEEAVKDLETKFLIAESNALKTASTELSEAEHKKVQKAKDLLAIASNEASSEQEKKVSFQQAFKKLEGIIVVPEVAVDTFRVKIGLKELETLTTEENYA